MEWNGRGTLYIRVEACAGKVQIEAWAVFPAPGTDGMLWNRLVYGIS